MSNKILFRLSDTVSLSSWTYEADLDKGSEHNAF